MAAVTISSNGGAMAVEKERTLLGDGGRARATAALLSQWQRQWDGGGNKSVCGNNQKQQRRRRDGCGSGTGLDWGLWRRHKCDSGGSKAAASMEKISSDYSSGVMEVEMEPALLGEWLAA